MKRKRRGTSAGIGLSKKKLSGCFPIIIFLAVVSAIIGVFPTQGDRTEQPTSCEEIIIKQNAPTSAHTAKISEPLTNKTTPTTEIPTESTAVATIATTVTTEETVIIQREAVPAVAFEEIDKTVCITKTGEKYHKSSCRYLSRSQIAITESAAILRSYEACKVCKP